MNKYRCKEGFAIELCDDDGGFTGRWREITEGSVWELSDDDYRFVGGADTVRLDRQEGRRCEWLEITKEHFEQYFEPVQEEQPLLYASTEEIIDGCP